MAFSDLQLEDLRERADIVAVLGKRVQLRRAGKDHVGLCPFHGERSPSFYVIPNKNLWHCFGCQEHGDIFKFFMKLDGMGFMDAVRHVSSESGIPIVEEQYDPEEAKKRAHLEELAKLVERAVKFYEQKLWHDSGRVVREYIFKRGVNEEFARKFHLGFAGTGMDELARALTKAGASPELAAEAGLCIQSRSGYFDRFHGRLITPIRVPRPPDGKSIAMGGRYLEGITDPPGKVLDRKPAKYINSPETPLYHKGNVLFGLDQARDWIRREERAVIVEGYFDVIGVHQAGLPLAVATCGTSLTPSHLDLLLRSAAKEIVFLFDGDEAGLRAAARAAEMCAKAQVPAKVATLPDGLDPDDFARQRGLDGLKALLDRAKPAVELLIDSALNDLGPSPSVEERVRAVQSVREIVLASPDGLSRELYINTIAERLHVPDSVVKQALMQPSAGARPRAQRQANPSPHQPVGPRRQHHNQPSEPAAPNEPPPEGFEEIAPPSPSPAPRPRPHPRASPTTAGPDPKQILAKKTLPAEEGITVALLKYPVLADTVAQEGILGDFGHPVLKSIAESVIAARQGGVEIDPNALLVEVQDDAVRSRLRQLMADDDANLEQAATHLNRVLDRLRIEIRRARARSLVSAGSPADEQSLREMLEKQQAELEASRMLHRRLRERSERKQ